MDDKDHRPFVIGRSEELEWNGMNGAWDDGCDELLELNRGHWEIENRLHWVRDVAFNEDRSQKVPPRPSLVELVYCAPIYSENSVRR